MNIGAELKIASRVLEKKYIIFSSDQLIYFQTLNEGVYADVLVVCENPEYWDGNNLLLTNPLLVVEVLSKSTAAYDRDGKFSKYKTLSSFKEYLLIRQDAVQVECWFREKPGLWHETILTDRSDQITLQSMGCSIDLALIYEHIEV